jgi:hypothetical protein
MWHRPGRAQGPAAPAPRPTSGPARGSTGVPRTDGTCGTGHWDRAQLNCFRGSAEPRAPRTHLIVPVRRDHRHPTWRPVAGEVRESSRASPEPPFGVRPSVAARNRGPHTDRAVVAQASPSLRTTPRWSTAGSPGAETAQSGTSCYVDPVTGEYDDDHPTEVTENQLMPGLSHQPEVRRRADPAASVRGSPTARRPAGVHVVSVRQVAP